MVGLNLFYGYYTLKVAIHTTAQVALSKRFRWDFEGGDGRSKSVLWLFTH